MADEARESRRRTAQRKFSRRKREERVVAGNLDPTLDYICSFCKKVYSLYSGRYKLHLRKCKRRIAQAAKPPRKVSLPSPPPFGNEFSPMPVTTGE